MKCNELAARLEQIRPDADTREIARLCLLLTNGTADLDSFHEMEELLDAWRRVDIRLQAVTDQHAAMTEELEQLARSNPQNLTPDQIWVLIRSIKVQSQILQLYVGEPTIENIEE